jgi:hypothetical protein
MKKTVKAARKAVNTRRARKALLDRYGMDTYDVLELAVRGKNSQEIEYLTGVYAPSARAVMANLTRGRYDDLLRDCNF